MTSFRVPELEDVVCEGGVELVRALRVHAAVLENLPAQGKESSEFRVYLRTLGRGFRV